jgi:asparagine synthase (glutamine-hydrolysing)
MSEGSLASLLRYGDRNAMRFSIENRVPFLTLGLAEFAISLPEEYLISKNGETKSIFRAAMRGIVPDEVLNRRDKIGFETPMGNLVQGLLKENVINNKKDIPFKFVKSGSLKAHFQNCCESPSSFTEQDWRIFNLLLYSQNRTV